MDIALVRHRYSHGNFIEPWVWKAAWSIHAANSFKQHSHGV